MSRLDTEVKKWQDEIISNETKLHTLEQQMALLAMWQNRAEAELKVCSSLPSCPTHTGFRYVHKCFHGHSLQTDFATFQLYVSQNQAEDKKRSVREQLLKCVSDQEKKSKLLKAEQTKVKESLGIASKQVKLWGQLERLFQCKQKCLEETRNAHDDSVVHREPGTETLVL